MRNPVTWFEIYVRDLGKAMAFYEAVLGQPLTVMASPLAHLKMATFSADRMSYGTNGALVQMDGFNPVGNSTLVYFECDDCAVEASRVEAAGGRIEHSKMPIGEFGFICHVYDIEGNLIGLHSMK
jgi:predicted enzyme related to lactoylglutathione lyase